MNPGSVEFGTAAAGGRSGSSGKSGQGDGGFADLLNVQMDSKRADSEPEKEKVERAKESQESSDGEKPTAKSSETEEKRERDHADGDRDERSAEAEAGLHPKGDEEAAEEAWDGKLLPLLELGLAAFPGDEVVTTTAGQLPLEGTAKTGRLILQSVLDGSETVDPEARRDPLRALIQRIAATPDAGRLAPLEGGEADSATRPAPRLESHPLVGGGGPQRADFATVLQSAGTPTNAAQSADARLTIPSQVGQPQWGQEVGERVVWMSRNSVQEAQIQLNPRHLGPIEVRVSVNQEQVNVHFAAHNGTTREALEAAMPRLREMLNEQGLSLGQSQVSDQSPQHQHAASEEGPGGNGRGRPTTVLGNGEADEGEVVSGTATVSAPGGIDYFA